MRSVAFHKPSYLESREPVNPDRTDARANLLAGLVLIGMLALSLLGLATLIGLVGYGVHLIFA